MLLVGNHCTKLHTFFFPCPACLLSYSSRDACEASANRRLSGQHLENVMARQKQLEHAADVERKRLEKVGTGNTSILT